ncbi:hypothetical protein [Sphingobacterium sp. UME9]|uniref:Uncharacterized protein n=1 Tax=Elizabethkingia anophelis TaxID=1117645 RepID=A0A455ZCR7_9FLAO|nr:TPA_exp: hypothetical protein [Elizabethkingia anophelis]
METKAIATKFVRHEVPDLEALKSSKVYQLREKLNKGERLSRAEKLACRSRKPQRLF